MRRFYVDRDALPEQFPTDKHSAEFWEHLGRAVASFGFLEAVLKKAIFALTASRRCTYEEAEELYPVWLEKMEKVLTSQLFNLALEYERAVKENPDASDNNLAELIKEIKESSGIRNALCHGCWQPPDSSGRSLPFYLKRNKQVMSTPVDIMFLKQVQGAVRHNHLVSFPCGPSDTLHLIATLNLNSISPAIGLTIRASPKMGQRHAWKIRPRTALARFLT